MLVAIFATGPLAMWALIRVGLVPLDHVSDDLHARHPGPGAAHRGRIGPADHGDRGRRAGVRPGLAGRPFGLQLSFLLTAACELYVLFYALWGSDPTVALADRTAPTERDGSVFHPPEQFARVLEGELHQMRMYRLGRSRNHAQRWRRRRARDPESGCAAGPVTVACIVSSSSRPLPILALRVAQRFVPVSRARMARWKSRSAARPAPSRGCDGACRERVLERLGVGRLLRWRRERAAAGSTTARSSNRSRTNWGSGFPVNAHASTSGSSRFQRLPRQYARARLGRLSTKPLRGEYLHRLAISAA